jgi:hypothetical protein
MDKHLSIQMWLKESQQIPIQRMPRSQRLQLRGNGGNRPSTDTQSQNYNSIMQTNDGKYSVNDVVQFTTEQGTVVRGTITKITSGIAGAEILLITDNNGTTWRIRSDAPIYSQLSTLARSKFSPGITEDQIKSTPAKTFHNKLQIKPHETAQMELKGKLVYINASAAQDIIAYLKKVIPAQNFSQMLPLIQQILNKPAKVVNWKNNKLFGTKVGIQFEGLNNKRGLPITFYVFPNNIITGSTGSVPTNTKQKTLLDAMSNIYRKKAPTNPVNPAQNLVRQEDPNTGRVTYIKQQ